MTGKSIRRRNCRGPPLFSPKTSRARSPASVAKGSRPRLTSSAAFRVVRDGKELNEKLGRNDLCPCGSHRKFQELLHACWSLRRHTAQPLLSLNNNRAQPRALFVPPARGLSAYAHQLPYSYVMICDSVATYWVALSPRSGRRRLARQVTGGTRRPQTPSPAPPDASAFPFGSHITIQNAHNFD